MTMWPDATEDNVKTLLWDIDGVTADFVYGFTSDGHRMHGTEILTTSEQPSWNFGHIMTKQQESAVWEYVKRTPGWWDNLRPMVHRSVFKWIDQLSSRVNMVFATSRLSNVEPPSEQTHRWLQRHGILRPNVVVTNKKGDIARAVKAQWSIEDKAENAWCIHWISDSPQTKSFLIDRPYNQDHPEIEIGAKRVIRIKTVEDFLVVVEADL